MAVGKRSTDLWGYVQRALLEQEQRPNGKRPVAKTIRLPVSPTVRLGSLVDDAPEADWHDPRNEARAALHLVALERALARGRERKASRRRARWLRTLHTDRTQRVRALAVELSLRCDPMGHGPVIDRSCVVYRDRLPWVLEPVTPHHDPSLPARVAGIIERWGEAGDLFDTFYRAHEPPTAQLPTQSLIGVVSGTGGGDWFVLDRWAT